MRKISLILLTILLSVSAYAQDNRTLDTKVADLLARMPVYNQKELSRQMNQMSALGEEGWNMVCKQIIEPGTGEDTKPRFLIESYTRYLSSFGMNIEQDEWENKCIEFFLASSNMDVKRFFMHQLNLVGKSKSSDLALKYLDHNELGEDAVRVIANLKTPGSEKMLAEALKKNTLVTAASVLNTLADWSYKQGSTEYTSWYQKGDVDIKHAALNAMASSGNLLHAKTLASAAKSSGYKWEATNATNAYINFAANLAEKGDQKSMEKICNDVIKNSDFEGGIQYKSAALTVLVEYKGFEALDLLIENFSSDNMEYRFHSLALAKDIPGKVASRKLLASLSKVNAAYTPDLIRMLGIRGDQLVSEALAELMFSNDKDSRIAAAEALTKLEGKEAAELLIKYIQTYSDIDELERAFALLSTLTDTRRREMIYDSYQSSTDLSKAFMLILLAEGGDNRYFDLVLSETNSNDELLRNGGFISLSKLAIAKDIPALLDLLSKSTEKPEIEHVQKALAVAALSIDDEKKRADLLITALETKGLQKKIIPVLGRVGGPKALKAVLKEFNGGDPGLKEVCFDALSGWSDYSASYALYDICKSDNKSYSRPAFEGYVRQVAGAPIYHEQKLLLFRKIMPYATVPGQKESVINNLSGIHTLPALMFVSPYLDDDEVKQAAARVAMSIALPGNNSDGGLYGDNVKSILQKVISVIDGDESSYYKERIKSYIDDMPEDPGFIPMFNGKDLSGWQGLVENPISRSKMSKSELGRKQEIANKKMMENWSAKDGAIWFSGKGANLCSIKDYKDFEMLVDWRITKEGDSGIYLRGTPQVQIWDTSRVEVGAQVGSGGLYNNSKNERNPLVVADNPVGDWNTFRIIMIGERVSVWLNGEIVVDDVVMENYWDRSIPIFPSGAIELQAHGNELAFRDIYVREIDIKEYNLTQAEKSDGFVALFNGSNLDNWIGAEKGSYVVEDGTIAVKPNEGSGGNLYTEKEYSDFNFRFEFKLTPGANNGLGIRTPLTGDAAYVGMEFQILDNTADIYANLQPYQYHGSVYGVIPAKRGFLRPVGEWNSQEVIVDGTHIKIILNGEVIVDGDIADARENGTMDHRKHPGLMRDSGHIGFLGHGSYLQFRNIRIKELNK